MKTELAPAFIDNIKSEAHYSAGINVPSDEFTNNAIKLLKVCD